MVVLLVEPEKVPQAVEIDGSLSSMQQLVKETIQAVYPFREQAALICNDEGKLIGMPLNRQIKEIADVIAGPFFICGIDGEEFTSLSEKQMERFMERFHDPEVILATKNGYLAITVPDREEELAEANVIPYRTSPKKKR